MYRKLGTVKCLGYVYTGRKEARMYRKLGTVKCLGYVYIGRKHIAQGAFVHTLNGIDNHNVIIV